MFQFADFHKKLAWALILFSSITIVVIHNMRGGYLQKFRPSTHNSVIPYQEELLLNFDRSQTPLESLSDKKSLLQKFSIAYKDTTYANLLISQKDAFVYLIWEWQKEDLEDHFTDASLSFNNDPLPTLRMERKQEGIFLGSLFSKPEPGVRFVLTKIAEETWKTYTKGKFFVYREFDGHILWVSKEVELSQDP
ncbi:MAG: hypothetical protein AAF518_24780 [Spirochaetota bacterium]